MRVTRSLTYATLAACVLVSSGAAARQQPVFRGTGDAVRVFVTVTDGDGRLVTTLARDTTRVNIGEMVGCNGYVQPSLYA